VPSSTDRPATGTATDSQSLFLSGNLFFLAVLLSFVAGGLSWWSQHKYEYLPKRWGVVVPGKIYRSGQLTPRMLRKTVEKHGITTIVDLQLNDLEDELVQGEVRYAAEQGIRHFRFGLGGDGTGDVDRYVNAVDVVIQCARKNDPVLVHCAAGTQRTGGIVACYRILEESADASAVVSELKEYEWNAEDDRELVDYLNQHLPYIAEQLVARGTLAERPAEIPRLEY
jgi:protein tyrosine/serine phosphatase